jgi:hypothetical protein
LPFQQPLDWQQPIAADERHFSFDLWEQYSPINRSVAILCYRMIAS